MPRPLREPRGPSPLVPALLRFAEARGVRAVDLAARLELSPDARDADEASIAPSGLKPLFDAVAEACGEPWVGLRLAAEPPRARSYAPLELAVRSSPTVLRALSYLAEHAPLLHPQVSASVVVEGETVRWVQVDPSPPRGVGRHAVEYGLGFVLTRCREVSTDPLRALRAWFVHARPRDIAPLEHFFGTTALTFGADDSGFALPGPPLEAPIESQNERLLATALDLAAGDLSRQASRARTTSLVANALPPLLRGGPTLETVARALAVSERTLQRRLDEEGTTFGAVLDTVRESRARQLLKVPEESLVDIAEALGFADLATFSRAFKRWTGRPPGTFRRGALGR